MNIRYLIFVLWLFWCSLNPLPAKAEQKSHGNLKLKSQPAVVGKKISDFIINHRVGWRYPKVCSYYGSLIFGEAIRDTTICVALNQKYLPFLKGQHPVHSGHVDYNVFGIWPFEMFRQTGDSGYLKIARFLADDEYKTTRTDGLSTYTRFWVDDMYMVGSLQIQAFKSLKDTVYLNRAACQLVTYCEKLQRPNGLFYHRNDAPFYWGRGNGWGAAAMAEVLDVLPVSNRYYHPLMNSYKKMMGGLLALQGKDWMWHQLLDDPSSFAETSCTGMFLYAMATGLSKGWLPRNDYGEAVQQGWNALSGYVNENGAVRKVCVGTNAKKNKKHYLNRPRSTGNFHGEAAVLWAATAMVRLQQASDPQRRMP